MIQQITPEEMSMACRTGRRGQFFCRMAHDDYMGLDNMDGRPMAFRGSFREVIETFVPFTGEVNEITREILRAPETHDEKPKKRYGLRKR